MNTKKIYILLPAYNEELSIPKCLADIYNLSIDVCPILVDDGSIDKTVEKALKFKDKGIIIIKHEVNKGLGKAIRTGFDYLIDHCNSNDLVITMDADCTHPIETVYNLIAKIDQGFDCVIASRFIDGGQEKGVSFFRRILSHSAGFILGKLFNAKVNDYTSGFRAYKVSILHELKKQYGEKYIEQTGFPCMAEILIKLLFINAKVSEVPLKLRYDLKQGKSKIKIVKTVIAYLEMILKIKKPIN
jgi:dolichol-phosphate mannosyltransferase